MSAGECDRVKRYCAGGLGLVVGRFMGFVFVGSVLFSTKAFQKDRNIDTKLTNLNPDRIWNMETKRNFRRISGIFEDIS